MENIMPTSISHLRLSHTDAVMFFFVNTGHSPKWHHIWLTNLEEKQFQPPWYSALPCVPQERTHRAWSQGRILIEGLLDGCFLRGRLSTPRSVRDLKSSRSAQIHKSMCVCWCKRCCDQFTECAGISFFLFFCITWSGEPRLQEKSLCRAYI